MDLLISTLFVMLTCCYRDAETRKYRSVLTVPNGAPWGTWGKPQFCTKGYANGFTLKVQAYQGPQAWNDDTSLNAIGLLCNDGQTISSSIGPFGAWTKPEMCPKGNLIGFSLRVEGELGPVVDDSAADNIRFNCDEGYVLTGQSREWGSFGKWSPSCIVGAICGIQTKVQLEKGTGDDTGLNDVKFFCCD
ncbi:vitelline membrane outer layer protein 1-like [Sceloporus undulatus]|uniref:vitelline membrane outer layer protein 1-like n=1 Tax=Sceloporus undulatus TaxID=8520 RepID=UPI001C4C0950|nr:vitelline membrane outer layer protein 1-like [Sceloporus undulatus]